jgi:hypothetical protein
MNDLSPILAVLLAFIAIISVGARNWASAFAFLGLGIVLTIVSFFVS